MVVKKGRPIAAATAVTTKSRRMRRRIFSMYLYILTVVCVGLKLRFVFFFLLTTHLCVCEIVSFVLTKKSTENFNVFFLGYLSLI